METKGCGAPVDVVPLAHEFAGYARRAVLPEPRQLKGQAYVLCVGSIEVRKNGLALLKAWIKVRDELGDRCPQLVFAGKYGWMIEEFHALLAATRHVHGTVTIVESPSDDELARLYRHCLFTVYPSLYEGWGLPVGEAAWFGKFGVVSRESSLPEVCGDLMDYIDPGSPSDIAAKIIRPLTDAAYLSMRTQRIEAAPLRTWTQVAEDFHRHLQPNRTVHASRATISSAE
jgi:glycosyltransferase involved in cell wall biosynthesis